MNDDAPLDPVGWIAAEMQRLNELRKEEIAAVKEAARNSALETQAKLRAAEAAERQAQLIEQLLLHTQEFVNDGRVIQLLELIKDKVTISAEILRILVAVVAAQAGEAALSEEMKELLVKLHHSPDVRVTHVNTITADRDVQVAG